MDPQSHAVVSMVCMKLKENKALSKEDQAWCIGLLESALILNPVETNEVVEDGFIRGILKK